jgi:hypothetical protein
MSLLVLVKKMSILNNQYCWEDKRLCLGSSSVLLGGQTFVFGKFISTVGRTNVCVWEVRQYCWEDKKCQSSIIFYCKIPTLCQPSAKSSQILLVMSDSTDELPTNKLICNFVNKQVFSLYRVLFRQVSLLKQY